jgi:hypothetical protein
MLPIGLLIENPRNPNRHPLAQIEALARIIESQGWRSPIVVSNRSGFIVKGHGRYEAGKRLAVAEVPVEYQDYATEAEEWSDMIADNRIAELSEIDVASLHTVLAEATAAGMKLESAGFTDAAFKELEKSVNAASPGAVAEASASDANDSPPGVTSERLVIGKYKVDVPMHRANEWLAEIYARFNNDEMLVIAEVKKRLGL